MQYFTPRSLGRAAADAGLSVAHMEAFGFADLDGIDRPHGRATGPFARFKALVRGLPGYRALHRLRQGLLPGSIPNERDGVFILFALLEKPRSLPPGKETVSA
jgi:hypothetical protein